MSKEEEQLTINLPEQYHCWNSNCMLYQNGICLKKWKEQKNNKNLSKECPIGKKTYRKED